MPDTLEQTAQTDAPVQSSLIPKGREKDYWELAMPTPVSMLDMVIDEANMYVEPLLITNGSEDRDGEVTNPDGLIDVAYKNAPVVFLQHSHRVAPMEMPVGTAETPTREYNLIRKSDGWYSGCRFHNKTALAEQTFQLVSDGVIRGRSIGALNHALSHYKPRLPGVAFANNQIVPVRTKSVSHDKYELIEWSWVFMPSNRDVTTRRKPQLANSVDKDVVPLLKSILCNNKIAGMPLDSSMKFIMKSLNLSEPATNLRGGGKVRHWPFKTHSGGNIVETPHAILFSSKSYSAADAVKFLKGSSDIGLIETGLASENREGQRFLKSVQFAYSGPTEVVTNPDTPGLVLLFAKAAAPEEVTEQVADEASQSVDVAAAQKPAAEAVAVNTAPAEEEAAKEGETAAVETAENANADSAKIPPGLRYLKALIKKATQVADEADAAMGEQETEMMEKCKEFTSELRGYIGKVAEFQAERYGKPDANTEEEKPASAMLEKGILSDLFYSRKTMLPQSLTKGLSMLNSIATDDKQKQLTAAMLKGVVGEVVAEKQPEVDKQQVVLDQLRRRLKDRLVKGITS